MCHGCWEENGSPRELPPDGDEVAAMISELYQREDGFTGGPLHVLVDDWNLDCLTVYPDYYTEETVLLSEQIVLRLLPMTEAQRGAVLARHEGWI